MILRHDRVVHVVAERRDHRDAERRLLGEVVAQPAAGEMQVLVDGRDDDPVGHAPALLPGAVLHRLVRQHEGLRIDAREAPQLDLRVGAQDVEGAVGRAVVVDDVAVD